MGLLKRNKDIFSITQNILRKDFVRMKNPMEETKRFIKYLVEKETYEAFICAVSFYMKKGKKDKEKIKAIIADVLLGSNHDDIMRIIRNEIKGDIVRFRLPERYNV